MKKKYLSSSKLPENAQNDKKYLISTKIALKRPKNAKKILKNARKRLK